jgi:hypothetical protein
MANEGNAIAAIAIGAGAGYALWHFFGDKLLGRDKATQATKPSGNPVAPSAPATSASTLSPARRTTSHRCQIRLDAKMLTVEGHAVANPDQAVASCRAMGSNDADLAVTHDAPSSVFGVLLVKLKDAGITPVVATV